MATVSPAAHTQYSSLGQFPSSRHTAAMTAYSATSSFISPVLVMYASSDGQEIPIEQFFDFLARDLERFRVQEGLNLPRLDPIIHGLLTHVANRGNLGRPVPRTGQWAHSPNPWFGITARSASSASSAFTSWI